MRKLRRYTQAGRLLTLLADGRWHGGPKEFGPDFHTARNRMGDSLRAAGFATLSRRRDGKTWFEYRLMGAETLRRARRQIADWLPWLREGGV